jgi:microsomal dipeptidase-like Zn-dependent dipeptidase
VTTGRRVSALLASALALLAASAGSAAGAGAPADRYALANGCWSVSAVGSGEPLARGASPFFFEPTGLGTYMLYDAERQLLSASGKGVASTDVPGPPAEWAVRSAPGGFALISTPTGRYLRAKGSGLTLSRGRSGKSTAFRFIPAHGCTAYPEATPGATGTPFSGTNPDGTVDGWADLHLHLTAEMRAGGRVLHGRSYARFGITRALGGDAQDHGEDGSLDVTGNLLRDGLPFGTHDTHGWPTFAGWPVHDTNTHQQTYYAWLQRAWMAGERLIVAQTVEDEPLCRIEPVRSHTCNETRTVKKEIRRLRGLQDYVDAQSGGPGEGWFRLVYSPAQARRVIERGKLAVVIGVESSEVLGCRENGDCTHADVNRGIAKLHRMGVRSLFVAHWVNNGFAGSALEGGVKGTFINVFNAYENGSYFQTGPCPHEGQGEEVSTLSPLEMGILSNYFPATQSLGPMPDYPPGPQCNVKGLTKLGAYLVRRLMAAHMMIDVDHMSELARDQVLRIAAARDYPLVSSHTGTGGAWVPSELRSLYAHGGIASATPGQAADLAAKVNELSRYARRPGSGVALGTDTGGFSSLPGPREDAAANPLAYPFESADGKVKFDRQRTGERTFDLNTDGVAHYGLFADLLADMRNAEGGAAATRTLFGSAEAYLRTWELASGR